MHAAPLETDGDQTISYQAGQHERGRERNTISYRMGGRAHERIHERNTIPCRTGDGRISWRGGRRPTDTFCIYFANVTSWNEGAQAYLGQEKEAMGASHVVCLVETSPTGQQTGEGGQSSR